MEKKIADTVNNVLTVLGGALLLYPLIDGAVKKLTPEMEKLNQSSEEIKHLPPEKIKYLAMMTHGHDECEESEHSKQEHKPQRQEYSRHDTNQ